MYSIIKTHSENKDFQNLVLKLDEVLAITDGDEHEFYHQYNSIDAIKHVIVVYEDEIPVGCGAIKHYDEETMEIKRMFVELKYSNQGLGSKIVNALLLWAQELNFKRCILETGIRQHSAIRLYEKNDFTRIQNYGQYKDAVNSICFEKKL
jgi:GNAT superfamily N-acetyltransferase